MKKSPEEMLSKLFEALTGTRQRVITVIPAVELAEIREVSKAHFLTKLNVKAAMSQHHFEYISSVGADRLALEIEEVLEESTQLYVKTERSQRLESEYNRLKELEDELVAKLLVAHGIEYTDEISFDITTGEVTIEESVDDETR